MKRLKSIPLFRNNRALSYTVSAVLMTGTTVILVLVASLYGYQILEQQRGAAEFEVAKKSFLAFNDALENVAWKPGGSRSTRFTIQYGYLRLVPNANNISISATVNGPSQLLSSNIATGMIDYWLGTRYVTFGDPTYESYIFGDNRTVISESTDSYGRAVIRQVSGWVTINLDYRVCAMRTSVIKVSGIDTNYVDIWVIKVSILTDKTKPLTQQPQWSYIQDFDLTAKCLNVQTLSLKEFPVSGNQTSEVSVQIGNALSKTPITLVSGKVVFNVVVAEVQVNV